VSNAVEDAARAIGILLSGVAIVAIGSFVLSGDPGWLLSGLNALGTAALLGHIGRLRSDRLLPVAVYTCGIIVLAIASYALWSAAPWRGGLGVVWEIALGLGAIASISLLLWRPIRK
jgi:hypothetical protein